MSEYENSFLPPKQWLGILMLLVAIAAFIYGDFYDEVIKSKVLTYTILPSYNLGNEYFSGIVIENRGSVPLTDIEITISGLKTPIKKINIPSPHELVEQKSGGQDQKEVVLSMPRLSVGSSLSVYIITSEEVLIEKDKTFLVTSEETTGISSNSYKPLTTKDIAYYLLLIFAAVVIFLFIYFFVFNVPDKDIKKTLAEVTIGEDTKLYQFVYSLPEYQCVWLKQLVDKKFTPAIFYGMHFGEIDDKNRDNLLFVLLSWYQHDLITMNETSDEITFEINPDVKEILDKTDVYKLMEKLIMPMASNNRLKKLNKENVELKTEQ